MYISRILKPSGLCILLTSTTLKNHLLNQVKYITVNKNCGETRIQTTSSSSIEKFATTEQSCTLLSPSCASSTLGTEGVCTSWTIVDTHYFKLGETHSVACVFRKERT